LKDFSYLARQADHLMHNGLYCSMALVGTAPEKIILSTLETPKAT